MASIHSNLGNFHPSAHLIISYHMRRKTKLLYPLRKHSGKSWIYRQEQKIHISTTVERAEFKKNLRIFVTLNIMDDFMYVNIGNLSN